MYEYIQLGPRYHNSQKIGGIVVSFEQYLQQLDVMQVKYISFDTNFSNYKFRSLGFIFCILFLLRNAAHYQKIVVHCTFSDMCFLAPAVILIGKIFKRKVVVKKFAGSFGKYYHLASSLRKAVLNFVIKNSDAVFFQTQYLVDSFKHLNNRIFHMPNCRPASLFEKNASSKHTKKLIFIGQIKEEKGVLLLEQVADMIFDNVMIDFVGSPESEYLIGKINAHSNLNYLGIIPPEKICEKLIDYDALILPSLRDDEGYPGVIIESFSVGLPVIASNVGGISEIVQNEVNGIIFNPGCLFSLSHAISSFYQAPYDILVEGAKSTFSKYELSIVINEHLKKIK